MKYSALARARLPIPSWFQLLAYRKPSAVSAKLKHVEVVAMTPLLLQKISSFRSTHLVMTEMTLSSLVVASQLFAVAKVTMRSKVGLQQIQIICTRIAQDQIVTAITMNIVVVVAAR